MQLFYHPEIDSDRFSLEEDESRHLIKVLRKGKGDKVDFTDGKGYLYQCVIIEANPKKTTLLIENRLFRPEDDFYIHLAICPTKNTDRMEWMVEKLVEIGVHEITFMQTEHGERSRLNMDRIMKKAIAACKQSIKFRVPKINSLIEMKDLIADRKFDHYQRFIAYVDKENNRHLMNKANPHQAYLILIGPEGDFSEKELQLAFYHHFLPCSLGESRLRSETAGLAAVHTLQLIQQEK